MIGQNEPHRPRDMRHGAQQGFAFNQSLAHKPDFPILKISQAAVKQLGRRRGRRRGQIVHLGQFDTKATTRSIARDATSVDATTDDKQIDHVLVFVLAQ